MGAGLGFSPIVGLYWANVSAKSFQVRFKGRQGEGMGLQNLEKTSRSLIKKRDEREEPCVCVRAAEPGTPDTPGHGCSPPGLSPVCPLPTCIAPRHRKSARKGSPS